MDLILIMPPPNEEMWPLNSRPIALYNFLGKPLIEHVIEKIRKNKTIKNIFLLYPEGFEDYMKKLSSSSQILKLPKNTHNLIDGILQASEYIRSEYAIFAYAHDIYFADFIGKKKTFPHTDFGIFTKNSEKKFLVEDLLPIIWLSKTRIEKIYSFLDDISTESSTKKSIYSIFQRFDQEKISIISIGRNYLKVEYPWNLLDVMMFLLREIDKTIIHETAKIDESSKIVGPVIIDSGVRIFRNSVIVGPTYVGKGSIIGDHVLIRECNIESNCLVGAFMEVARSLFQKNMETHSGYIGDSIFDCFSHTGAGFITANLRLDRKNIFVKLGNKRIDTKRMKLGVISGMRSNYGVNASTMPGTLVGNNTVIGPGTVLFENVPDNTTVYVKQTIIKKESRMK